MTAMAFSIFIRDTERRVSDIDRIQLWWIMFCLQRIDLVQYGQQVVAGER